MKPLPELSALLQHLPARALDANKGDFGTVLVIGGQAGMAGAPLMAAQAAQRIGAGKVIIATDLVHASSLMVNWPSVMVYGVKDEFALQALCSLATHIAIGPGLGQSAWSRALLHKVLSLKLPLIVDADGLNLLAQQIMTNDHWILTPHVGEAARLLACPLDEVMHDRAGAVIALQKKYGGVVVLKGAHSLIVDEKHEPWQCQAGNPGMASAGMGDILTGVIAGLAAQGLSLLEAAQLGVSIHASAGDLAAQQGMRGMIATDLLPFIRQLVNPR